MSGPAPVVPLSYVAHKPRPGDSVWGIAAFALAVVCATLPADMVWQLVTHARHNWGVYAPYAGSFAALRFGVNWPWYLLDTLAILGGGLGLRRGRARFGASAVAVGFLSMAMVMTVVLGSPW